MPRAFECRDCRFQRATKWDGICPNCYGYYNIREVNAIDVDGAETHDLIEGVAISLQDAIDTAPDIQRIETGIVGVDRVLGGGIVPGSLTLLCGDPGAGKSSLLVQVFQSLAKRREPCLYVTGEESVGQMAYRYKNFGKFPPRMQAINATDIDQILDQIEENQPTIVAIDSIQLIEINEDLETGSATSVKIAIREFMKFAKENKIAFFVVGHVTKGGAIGGPRALEHIVDVSIHLSGRQTDSRRVLHCYGKNRFGKTPIESVFEMSASGLIDRWKETEEEEAAKIAAEKAEIETAKAEKEAAEAALASSRSVAPSKLKPILKSIPLEDNKPAPIASWTAPDGTSAAVVLAVGCDVDGCLGKVDRACTADDGTREAGFHDSRIEKAKLKITTDKPTPLEEPEPLPPEMFPTKPFGAPAKVKAKTKTSKASGKKPKPSQPRP